MSIAKVISQFAASSLIAFAAVATANAADQPMSQGGGSQAIASLADTAITTKVKAVLASNKLSGISVTTEMGVVALSGIVTTEEMRQSAAKIAASVDGVKGVDYTGLAVKAAS